MGGAKRAGPRLDLLNGLLNRCAVDGDQRLDLAMASSGQPVEPVLMALNNLVSSDSQNEPASSDMLKTPNVELVV